MSSLLVKKKILYVKLKLKCGQCKKGPPKYKGLHAISAKNHFRNTKYYGSDFFIIVNT